MCPSGLSLNLLRKEVGIVGASTASGCHDICLIPFVIFHRPNIGHYIITTTIAFIKHNAIPLCRSIEHIAEQHNAIYTSQQMLTQLRSMILF